MFFSLSLALAFSCSFRYRINMDRIRISAVFGERILFHILLVCQLVVKASSIICFQIKNWHAMKLECDMWLLDDWHFKSYLRCTSELIL